MNRKRHINIHISGQKSERMGQREWAVSSQDFVYSIFLDSIYHIALNKYQTLGHIVWHGRNSPEIRKITNNFSTFGIPRNCRTKTAQQLYAIEMGRFLAAACKRIGILLCERC